MSLKIHITAAMGDWMLKFGTSTVNGECYISSKFQVGIGHSSRAMNSDWQPFKNSYDCCYGRLDAEIWFKYS